MANTDRCRPLVASPQLPPSLLFNPSNPPPPPFIPSAPSDVVVSATVSRLSLLSVVSITLPSLTSIIWIQTHVLLQIVLELKQHFISLQMVHRTENIGGGLRFANEYLELDYVLSLCYCSTEKNTMLFWMLMLGLPGDWRLRPRTGGPNGFLNPQIQKSFYCRFGQISSSAEAKRDHDNLLSKESSVIPA
ncbi:hypothetical protein L1987_64196 [Smallanthus sonchifolius]|uniref:Uncharacterized protein n=1 Tax=Smallanthus sonchifolius TaxID=185202 RepID=A0ACB9CFD1_9ASTR|nr:hypothetical protein L1987_64196 [Smallanthus sonchifolius]